MTDWLDELFEEAEKTNEGEIQILEYISRLLHSSNHCKTYKLEMQNYIWSDGFDMKESREIIRKLRLNQKSAFDEDMPNKVGDVARLAKDRMEIDNSKEKK